MRNLILIAHTSLDGYVADTDGSLRNFHAGNENLAFVNSICREADTALMGRASYQLLNDFWPGAKDQPQATPEEIEYSTWYNDAQKIVISSTLEEEGLVNTWVIRENILSTIEHFKNMPGKSIILFGSPSIAQLLMRHDLLDIYWIFINPGIFGTGIPLFREQEKNIPLELGVTRRFPNGELALEYQRHRG